MQEALVSEQTLSKPVSPKLKPQKTSPSSDSWYPYYAGYSTSFVREILQSLGEARQPIADPWNGSGTTTAVAEELGICSWGTDISPAMVVIAKARLLGSHVTPSEISLCEGVLSTAETMACDDDPLSAWFTPESTQVLRGIERSIARLLDPCAKTNAFPDVSTLSPLASYFYLALFRTVRGLLVSKFRTRNPTWIKRPALNRSKLSVPLRTAHETFRLHVERMASSAKLTAMVGAARSPANPDSHSNLKAQIGLSNSTKLPFGDHSVGAVVSSPPYCTRIDYAVATSPELAVLGIGGQRLRELRESMIGSSTVRKDEPALDLTWGGTCAALLEGVATHSSKASATYYLRNHLQYFDGLVRSLREIDRVLRPRSPCVLVVQDSFYKEIHNDLPTIVTEMAEAQGWHPTNRHDYKSPRHMARVNRGSKVYRQKPHATESVLVFRTAC